MGNCNLTTLITKNFGHSNLGDWISDDLENISANLHSGIHRGLRPGETWSLADIHLTLTVVLREGSYEAVGTGGSRAWNGGCRKGMGDWYLIRNWSIGTKLGLIFTECFSTPRRFPMQAGRGTGNRTPRKVRAVVHRVAHPEHFTFVLYLGTTWNLNSCWGARLLSPPKLTSLSDYPSDPLVEMWNDL